LGGDGRYKKSREENENNDLNYYQPYAVSNVKSRE